LNRKLSNANFVALAIFFTAIIVRALPEIIVGGFPTGYDTTDGYIVRILSPLAINLQTLFTTPLVYDILSIIHFLTTVDPFVETAILAPLFYGIFIISFYFMLHTGFNWSLKKTAITSILFLFEPVVLRTGWDLLREELALAFLFILVGTTKGQLLRKDKRKLVFFLTMLIVLTEQLISILLFVIILAQSFWTIYRERSIRSYTRSIYPVIPSFLTFLGVFLNASGINIFSSSPSLTFQIGKTPTVTSLKLPSGSAIPFITNYYLSDPRFIDGSYITVVNYVLSLTFYTILFLIPFSVIGFRKDKTLTPMLIWMVVAGYGILLLPATAPAYYWRWIILLAIPLTVYGANGVEKIVRKAPKIFDRLGVVFVILLVSVGILYSTTTLLPINAAATTYIPSNMTQGSFSISQSTALGELASYVTNNSSGASYILTTEDFVGVLTADLHSNFTLILSPSDLPLQTALADARNTTIVNANLYVIWYCGEIPSGLNLADEKGSVCLYQNS
jgi:hypothetical protein